MVEVVPPGGEVKVRGQIAEVTVWIFTSAI
jgi:hypothetical protein